jgi:hypothetical protein
MKTKLLNVGLLAFTMLFTSAFAFSQGTVEQKRTVSDFNAIEVGGAFKVTLSQGNENAVTVISDEENIDRIITEVSANTLEIYARGIRNASKLEVNITCKTLERLEISGAAQVSTTGMLAAENFVLEASGASKATLTLNVNTMKSEISGAADVKLSGNANNLNSEVSGAGHLKATELETSSAKLEVSGAANAKINAKDEVEAEVTGAGSFNNIANPPIQRIEKNGTIEIQRRRIEEKSRELEEQARELEEQAREIENNISVPPIPPVPPVIIDDSETITEYNADSTRIIIRKHKHHRDNDHSIVILGDKKIIVDDEGIKYEKDKHKNEFNGHWGGLDLGINGYLTSDNDMEMADKYEYLDLKYEKSINVDINLYEQNINLINNHLGLITGIGLTYNNYRFDNNTVLVSDTNIVYGFVDNTATSNYKKTKLLVNYLTVPLLLEYQTNDRTDVNSFHITAGLIGGIRYGSHTKIVLSDGKMTKNHDDFHLNPFKLDATARIGWGLVNLYGTYSLTTLFKDGKDPELYPFSLGIAFDVNNW